jgi:hypothetical protein
MKKLSLLLVFASVAFGQANQNGIIPLPPDIDNAIAGTVNFEGTVTLGVTDLVTNVAPSIMPFGWTMLAFFGVHALLQTLLQGTMRSLSAHHYNPLATTVAYVAVLFRISVAALMMTFYLVPLPGLPFNFHQMFPYLANALSNAITTDLLKQVLGHFNDAIHFLPPVGFLQVLPAAITVLVLVLIALGQVAMTIITAGSYAIVGLLTLCGPLMIPFYVLPGHDKSFWRWFDNMLAYSMYVFVGAGFIYVFCHSYLDFFFNLHGWSVGNWLVHIPYLILITVVFLWTMFKVPEITHIIFGGVGGVASGFANTLQSLAVLGIGKLL